ncbi:MAG: cobalamin biosynthesis protein CobD [Acidobacteria bacterium]|nr:MAG: cobalamin biosynthesis protein CobD [Acidobacteriota bacterium]
MIHTTTTELFAGASLDLLVGDPWWFPHPVRGIGRMVAFLERPLRRIPSETFAGCVLVCSVVAIAAVVSGLTVYWGGAVATVYWIFACMAVRSLDRESCKVILALRNGDLQSARKLTGHIVGRDTNELSEQDVTRAVFETVGENMSDAIVAPLFFLAVFGVPGMVAYKAINTMDSMVGYKNEKYIRFGWAAARLDDVANYIPARMTAALIVVIAACLRLRWRQALAVVWRDAGLQPSPNSGYPEAALAGALGVQLGGLNYYFGRPSQKPFLGDSIEDLRWNRFPQVRRLLYCVALVSYTVVGLWLSR